MFRFNPDRQYDYYRRFREACGVGPDDWLLVCAYGLGDTYFTCGLAMAFRDSGQVAPGQRIVVAVRRGQTDIYEMFSPFIDACAAFDEVDLEPLTRFGHFHAGSVVVCHPFHYGDGRLANFLTHDGVHLLDLHRFMLNLPFSAPLAPPLIKPEWRQAARAKVEAADLPRGRTALLAPHAFSSSTLPLDFWQSLANRLGDAGWTVALNEDPRFPVDIEGAIPVSSRIGELVPLANHCGWVITQRSGLCDILSTSSARMSVLYTRPAEAEGRFHEFHAYGLREMGLIHRAEELVVDLAVPWTDVIEGLVSPP